MPDPDADERHSERLLPALVWGGVTLAPIAVLVALVGGGGPSLRFAVLLLAVAVILIGSSLLIRNDPVLMKLELDDRLARHTDDLRAELRDEIAAAARATHHRVQTLQDDLTRLRGPAVPAARQVVGQRAPGTTSRAVPVPGTAAAVVRAVPVPPAVAVARAVAVPPTSSAVAAVPSAVAAAPPYGGRGRAPAASAEAASRHSKPRHDDAPRRDDERPRHGDERPRRGDRPAQHGDDAAQRGGDPLQRGDDALRSGDDPLRRGDEALRRGDDPLRRGDDPLRRGDDPLRRGDDPLRRHGHGVGDGGGRRSRRRRASEDVDKSAPRRHAGLDRYDAEGYGPDPQARPVEQGDWREPAPYGEDELGRW